MNENNSSRRPLNVSYLVVGLVFLGIAGSWALHQTGAVDTSQVQWLIPFVLVGAGVIGLVAFAAKGLSRGRRETTYDDQPEELDEPDLFQPDHTQADTEATTRIEGDDR